MKRLSIFLDGTWSNPASRTNVSTLCNAVAARGADGVQQVPPYYATGVGTHRWERIRGGAAGLGLSRTVRAAYAWLLQHYEDGDDVYLFGFSRGAYSARSLGGLIACCGLAKRGAPFGLDYLYLRYQHRKLHAVPISVLSYIHDVSHARRLTEEECALLEHSRRIQIKFIGVWDTIGALGIPWTGLPLVGHDRFFFHNPNLSRIYENGFHALAIDEHRRAYKPTLWTRFAPDTADGRQPATPLMPSPKNVEQRWFIGAHSNIGGGYQNDPLARLPLAWLQSKAEGTGLHFNEPLLLSGDEHCTPPFDSYSRFLYGAYRWFTLGQRYYRPIGVVANKVNKGWSFPVNEYIDASVFRRCAEVSTYRPPNVVEWSERAKRKLEAALGDQAAL